MFLRVTSVVLCVLWGGGALAADHRVYAPDLAVAYGEPRRTTMLGFAGDILNPVLTRNGRYLLFNDASARQDLHYAMRKDPDTFVYKGRLGQLNTPALESVPSIDWRGSLYYISAKSFGAPGAAIYRSSFRSGNVSRAAFVVGRFGDGRRSWFNMDVEVSADGGTLYVTRASKSWFQSTPQRSDLVMIQRQGLEGFGTAPHSDDILRNVNTKDLEFGAALSPDESTLFFARATARAFQRRSSEGSGIFVAAREQLEAPFGDVTRVAAISGFVGSPTLGDNGCSLYYHKADFDFFVVYRVVRSDCASGARTSSSRNAGTRLPLRE